MSTIQKPNPWTERLKIELLGLGKCVNPSNGTAEDAALRKWTTLLLMAGWLAWSIGKAGGALDAGPDVFMGWNVYTLFSFVVIYAFARLHDLEVDRLLSRVSTEAPRQEDVDRREDPPRE